MLSLRRADGPPDRGPRIGCTPPGVSVPRPRSRPVPPVPGRRPTAPHRHSIAGPAL